MNHSATLFRVLSTRRTTLSLTALLALGGIARAETLLDPTRPATAREATQSPATGALQIEAIMDSGPRRIAIINGKIVRAGDRIGTALIEEIHSDSIRYTRDGRSSISRITKPKLQVRHD
jgi:MSHA biogenesis protein MshK